jgi:hypothetical protein
MSERKLGEFKASLLIDKNDLDNELEVQPQMYYMASEELAQAVSSRDAAKEDLARVDARLYDEIAKRDEKLSDSKIRAQVSLHRDHVEAFEDYNAARSLADRWAGMVESWRQRGSMLRQLAELYVTNYYTTGSTTHTSRQASDIEAEKGRGALRDAREGSTPRRRVHSED